MPKVSVIVPVYKVEKYLNRCVDSILNQTFQDFELILVDDGSPDNCGMICNVIAKNDSRVKVIHKENGGLSSARNAGIKVAEGEFLSFVDSDDWISKDMLSHMVSLAEQYKSEIVSVSYCLATVQTKVKQNETKISVFTRDEALLYYMKEGMSKRIADYPAWIKLYKRELFDGFEFPEGQLYEDVATNFALIKKVNCYVKSSRICYYYFQEGSSIVRSGFKMRDMDAVLIGNQLIKLSEGESQELKRLAYEKRARAYFSMLSKIVVYGIDESVKEPEKVTRKIVKHLRKNYRLLMSSSMPLNRKILMTVFAINYKIPAWIAKKIRS